eukprot:5266648-Pyramimonas_sp.AAC.1
MVPFWQQVELHHDGDGLGQGVETYSLRRLLQQLRGARPGGPRLAGLLLNIAIVAAWPKARKVGQLKSPGRACPVSSDAGHSGAAS